MRTLLHIVLLWAAWHSTARAQDGDASDETSASADAGTIVVVVESTSRALRPDALRESLRERLSGAEVVALELTVRRPRARVLVAVARDGSAALHLLTRAGRVETQRVPAPSGGVNPPRRLAEKIDELLAAAEGNRRARATARHGLIPWEEDGNQPTSGFERVEEDALLPWPQGGEATPRGPGRPARETGDGLATPPPPAQNR